MTRPLLTVLAVLASFLLAGCTGLVYKAMPATQATGTPKQIAVFFDGTHNDIASDTNVKRLHSLVSLQDRSDLASLYVEGVGVGRDVLGMATGLGLKRRVVLAYTFLLEQHEKDDLVYLFGFSRGAFAARVLASMLYHAGLPKHPKKTHTEIAEAVFDAVKHLPPPGEAEAGRRARVEKSLKDKNITIGASIGVEVLGLWDTVEALGRPDWMARLMHKAGFKPLHVDVDEPNSRYGDQLCNVRRAYHAVSLDDDREWIFTPLLLSRRHLFEKCTTPFDDRIVDARCQPPGRALEEVWFSGAHSDVGGGYGDSRLSGVSLNWMLDRLKGSCLLPPGARVPEDPHGTSHDPEAGWFGPLYHAINRNPAGYAVDALNRQLETARGSLCVHPSVFERRSLQAPKPHENDLLVLKAPGAACLVPDLRTGRSDPQRYRETLSCGPDAAHVRVQRWPDCSPLLPRKVP